MERVEKFRALAEGIGTVAVVVSLIFVGDEVRDTNRAIRAATQQQVADVTREMGMAMALDPELPALLIRADGDTSLAPVDSRRLALYQKALLRLFENVHCQYRAGVFDAVLWRGWLSSLASDFAGGPDDLLQQFWQSRRSHFNIAFQMPVDSIISASGGPH